MKKLLAILTLLISTNIANAAQVVDSIVAVVNTDVITRQDLDSRFALTMRQLPKMPNKQQQRIIYRQTLNKLIDESLQQQFAQKHGIIVRPANVQATIAKIEAQNGWPAGGFAERTKGLEQVAQKRIEQEVLWAEIIRKEIAPRVIISNAELDPIIKGMTANRKVEEFELSQIFITIDDDQKQTEQKLEQVEQQLKSNVKFTDVAKTFSDDSSAQEGGKMGWFSINEISPQLAQVVKQLQVGEVSKAIRTADGWHILKLNDKKVSDMQITEEQMVNYRNRVGQRLKAQRVDLMARRFMRDMRRKAFIDIRL